MSAVSLSRKVVALTTTLATMGTALALVNPPRPRPQLAGSGPVAAESEAVDDDELPTWSHFERYRPQALPQPGGLERWIGARAGSPAHSGDGPHQEATATTRTKPFDLSTLCIDGATSFDAQDIRNALEWDLDLQLALIFDALESETTGQATERRTLNRIERALESGYQRAGFGDVTVDVHADEASGQIVARITEGECYRCAGTGITGTRAVPDEAVLAGLVKSPWHSWVLWTSGEPVPFDAAARAELRRQVATVCSDRGYRSPQFSVEIVKNAAKRSATLVVRIEDDGPRTLVETIDVTGAERDSVEEVLNYLELRPGMPFEETLPDRLKRKLWESGRYWTYSVKASLPVDGRQQGIDDAVEGSAAPKGCSLQIELEEYSAAPPLRDELSPAEQAVLRLGDWLRRWARGEIEDDIVLNAALGPQIISALPTAALLTMGVPLMLIDGEWFEKSVGAERQPPEAKVTFRAVLAPRRGQVIAGQATDPEGRALADVCLAVQPDSVVLASRRRRTEIELRHDAVWQPEIKVAAYPRHQKDDQRLALYLNLESVSRSRGDGQVQPASGQRAAPAQ